MIVSMTERGFTTPFGYLTLEFMANVTINFLDNAGPVAERPRRYGVYVERGEQVELCAVIYCAALDPAGWTVRDLQGNPVLPIEVMQRLWKTHTTHAAQRRRLRELVLDHFKIQEGEHVRPHKEILRRNAPRRFDPAGASG